MKKNTVFAIISLAASSSLSAQGLYYVGQEAEESIPLTWSAGFVTTWDNNVTPVIPEGQPGYDDEAWSITPYVQANLTNIDPQTTINFYARAGVNYFLDGMEAINANDVIPSAQFGFDISHSVSERVRVTTRNFLAYELEPQFAFGFSNDRQADPYFFYSSDTAVGYRWTQRVGSYTGFGFTGFLADTAFADRKSWSVYHQMRYQLFQRTVLTAQYRYTNWTGDFQGDSVNHFITAGMEHRISQNSTFVANAGIQLREVEGFESTNSPFAEGSLRTQLNSRFGIRGFIRYSTEDFDTIQFDGANTFQYNDQQVFRLGLTGDYRLTPRITGFGGLDWINTSFGGGTEVGGTLTDSGRSEDLYNIYIGLRTQVTDAMSLDCTINHTDSSSGFPNNDFDRLRMSTGLNYTF